MGIHFKTDIFAVVAVVDAKAPYCHRRRRHRHRLRRPHTHNIVINTNY